MAPHWSCLTDVALVRGHIMQFIKCSALWMVGMLMWFGLETSRGVCCDPSLELPHRSGSGGWTQHAIYQKFSALDGEIVVVAWT